MTPRTEEASGIGSKTWIWILGNFGRLFLIIKSWNVAPSKLDPLIPILLGITAFYFVVGPKVLESQNIAWLSVADPVEHFLGWNFYRYGPWGFPIGLSPNYGLEFSNSIVYTDSIPLLAIPFKTISYFLPKTFQYFGYWYLLCFVMMAWFSWKLVATISESKINCFFVTGLFVFSPPMLWRLYGHEALVGHFLIIAGLYLSLRKNQDNRISAWSILVSVTALVHAYLLAMVFVFWLSNLISAALRRDLSNGKLRNEVIVTLILLFITCWQAGYFTVGGDYGGGNSYGYYRANLLTFIDPGGFSYVLKDIARAGVGDFEGFAYPGLGVLILFVAVIPILLSGRTSLFRVLKQNTALVIALLFLTAYAFTNKLALGPHVYVFPLPASLGQFTEIFRAAGRMIWPAQYAITFLIVYIVVSHKNHKVTALLGFAFFLQIADTHAGWKNLKPNFMNEPESEWETPLKSEFWRAAAPMYKKLVHITPVNAMNNWNVLADYASKNRLATDAAYFARVDVAKISRAQELSGQIIKSGRYDRESIYVIDDNLVPQALEHIDNSVDILAKIDGFNVVAPGWRRCSQCPSDVDELYLLDGLVTIKKGDKSVEKVTNGNFASGTTNWRSGNSAKLSTVNGKLRVTNRAAAAGNTRQTLWLTAGSTYVLRFTWIKGTAPFISSAAIVVDGTASYFTPTDGVEFSHVFIAGSSNYIILYIGDSISGHYSDFDDVSVVEADKVVPGAEVKKLSISTVNDNQ